MSEKSYVPLYPPIFKHFIIISLIVYIEIIIIPGFIASEYPKKPDKEILSFLIIMLSWVAFIEPESIRLVEKKRRFPVLFHILSYALFWPYLFYVAFINRYNLPIDKDNFFMKVFSYFNLPTSGHFTFRFILGYLVITTFCHLSLLSAVFQGKRLYRKYVASAIISLVIFRLNLNSLLWNILASHVAKISVFLLRIFGFNYIYLIEENPIIGTASFNVSIWYPCSGLEGMTTFMVAFMAVALLYWKRINKSRLIVWSGLGVLTMYITNVLRIFIMILIGHFFGREPAVGIWHSWGGFVLYLGVTLVLITAGYRWCINKNWTERRKRPSISWREFFVELYRDAKNMAKVGLRFPIDLVIVWFHSIALNLMKTKTWRKIFNRGCQIYRGKQGDNIFCVVSPWYGTPGLIKCVCKFANAKQISEARRINCTTNLGATPVNPFRSLLTFLIGIGLVVFMWWIIRNYQRTYDLYADRAYVHKNMGFLMEDGEKLFDKGLYEQAKIEFDKVISVNSNHADALSWVGRCLEGMNNYEKAIPYYMASVKIDPSQGYAHMRIANFFLENIMKFRLPYDYLDKVESHAKLALSHKQDHVKVNAMLALCEILHGNLDASRAYLKEPLPKSDDIDKWISSYVQGVVATVDKNMEKAEKLFVSLTVHPIAGTRAGLDLAGIYVSRKEFEKAENILQKRSKSRNPTYAQESGSWSDVVRSPLP